MHDRPPRARSRPAVTLREALLRGRRRPRAFGSGSPTTYRGDGYEFVELRAYVPGDDVRRIDWAATARSGDLQTRVVLEDVALTLALVLDDSASMSVGRRRPLADAANEAMLAWYGAASGDDRCIRIGDDTVVPRVPLRGLASAHACAQPLAAPFDLRRALQTARAALPRGAALLAIGDWFGVDASWDALLSELGRHADCTALVARDPWHDDLPLAGLVRLRGAEGGTARVFVGARERGRFYDAVRARERDALDLLGRAGWRTGLLHEADGSASIAQAFGLHDSRAGAR